MELQIFNNPEFGDVRIMGDYENPRFCLSDVCKILDLRVDGVVARLKKDANSTGLLDEGILTKAALETAGGVQQMYFVNEDGLYDVILDSRKPFAKRFRKWITSEVLPAIRKYGVYADPRREITAEMLRRMADALDARDKKIALLEVQNAELQPKADYCDVILQCADLVTTSVIAKDYGYSAKRFNKLLHELKIQFKQGDIWLLYQKYAAKGWSQTKTHKYTGGDGQQHCKVHTYWTQKGRIELYHILKRNGIAPMIER